MEESDLNPMLEQLRSLSSPRYNDGEHLIEMLKGLVRNLGWNPADVVLLFVALRKRFLATSNEDGFQFVPWMLKILHGVEKNYITSRWRSQGGQTVLDLVQDRAMTDTQLKEYLDEEKEKQLEEIVEEIRKEKLNQVNEELLEKVKEIVAAAVSQSPLHRDGSEQSELKEMLRRLCLAVKKTAGYTPRLTQMVSWCLMALSKTGRLLQVATGEGKSCLVAMFAAFRALKGEKVDIMSSSSVLAEKDLDDWRTFYESLGISVACNSRKLDEDLKKCYKCQVVYGTVEQFARDWLKQGFQRKDIFGERKFQCAIVDEVDSLMLDKGHNVVYLGTDMPALQHLNPLLALIWATTNQYKKISKGIRVGPKQPFYQVVLDNIESSHANEFSILQLAENTGILAKGSVLKIRRNSNLLAPKIKNVTVDQLVKFFKATESKFPSCQFALYRLNNSGELEELNKNPSSGNGQRVPLLLTDGGYCQYTYPDKSSMRKAVQKQVKASLCFTPCKLCHAKSTCHLPHFLSHLVESKLNIWIENAFHAQKLTRDDEYIMEKHGIVPVDYSCTGVNENFMQWTDGLQQFLEMKHGSKVNNMGVITNFKSNVGMLQMYGNQIYGMSGTLGQQAETETLQKIYNGTQTCRIPTFKRRKLFEVEGEVMNEDKEWIERICEVVIQQVNATSFRGRRAVLVICETIKRAKGLDKALTGKVMNKKLYISNNMDNSAVLKQKLEAGEVIIATNLAGRGTDLQVSDSVKAAGGLFVVQTFIPNNARVQTQAFGRTARQGAPGSAQLIICSAHLSVPLQLLLSLKGFASLFENLLDPTPVYQCEFLRQVGEFWNGRNNVGITLTLLPILTRKSTSPINLVKDIRDKCVAKQLSNYLESVIPNLGKKEELFNLYLKVLDEVYKSRNNNPPASEVSALNEFWAMWLLTEFDNTAPIESLKSKLSNELKIAREKLLKQESPSSNLHYYTELGNELQSSGDLAGSIKMFTKAIQADPHWAAVAYYKRAFVSLSQKNGQQEPRCILQAMEDLQNARKSAKLYLKQVEITQRHLAEQATTETSVSRLEQHLRVRRKVFLSLVVHIEELIKKLDRADDFGMTVKVEESLVYLMLPAELLPLVLHSLTSIGEIRTTDPFTILQLVSNPSCDILHEFHSLRSLGLTHIFTLDTSFSVGGLLSKIFRKMT